MKSSFMRVAPIVAALGLATGLASGQTASSTAPAAADSSSMTGGRAAPATQPGTGTRNTESKKDDQISRSDRKFIQEAAEGGMFEVEVAQLASSRASDAGVKGFATKLLYDHQNANNELVQLANSKHVELSAAPPRSKRQDIEKLAKLSGADFDRHFLQEVGIKDHEKDIKKFEKASGKAKDPQLKAWVDKTLPKLREHLAQAQKLHQSANNPAAMGNTGSKS
jgi:putative membrane protein